MILTEEVRNWFLQKTEYDENMHKLYALILGHFAVGLKNQLQVRKYWETYISNQPTGILKAIK